MTTPTAIPYTNKQPRDFYLEYKDRAVCHLNGATTNYQCVCAFKEFLWWIGAGYSQYSHASVGGNADQLVHNLQSQYAKHFVRVNNDAPLQDGDWVIWAYDGTGHIAMWFNNGAFGQNQCVSGVPTGSQGGQKFTWVKRAGSPRLGAWRWEKWKTGVGESDYASLGMPSNSTDTTSTPSISTSINVDYTKLTPYIIELNRNSPDNVDIVKLKNKKVVSVLIECGEYFDKNHKKVDNFRNPKLAAQIKKTNDAKMPFGLYMTAKAKSVDDVKHEMYEFGILLRKYHPNIGAWLKLDLQKDPNKNADILARYKQELEWLGLKYKIGFMATEEDLESQIKWSDGKYKDDWMLWVNNHVQSLSEINKLLDPMFFDIPYTGVPDTSSTATTITSTNLSAISTTSSMGSVAVPNELDSKWKTGIASAYGGFQDAAIADNQRTATGDPVTENSMGVAIPMAWNRRDLYLNKHKVYIRYKGKVCLATINDCGGMGGGSRALDLQPGVTKFFGIIGASNWGLRTVEYIIV